jgi:hypothetical protein
MQIPYRSADGGAARVPQASSGGYVHPLVGSAAGVVSTVVFAWIHQLTISDIWNTLPAMSVAGAISGALLAWSHSRLFPLGTPVNWLGYNALHVLLLGVLAVASIAWFEPITTFSAVVAANAPPRELMSKALPLSCAFAVGTALLLYALWGRSWRDGLAALLASTAIMVLLGANVSVLGLVEMTQGGIRTLSLFFALFVLLAFVYSVSAIVAGLGTRALRY